MYGMGHQTEIREKKLAAISKHPCRQHKVVSTHFVHTKKHSQRDTDSSERNWRHKSEFRFFGAAYAHDVCCDADGGQMTEMLKIVRVIGRFE